ncbi:uncharacterized protein LOC107268918 [Cephus cinctus]|uniref:Uncharacterized protein LOC107268918 n=1 Tax=Cephus cinctus TaxID=211228 RepID=A0AAJ7BYR6_CEPCN|nr:uncharacterized protein LOC107268918 [Cephus cinctus]
MNQLVLILALTGVVLGGTIVQPSENLKQQKREVAVTSATSGGNQLQSSQYYYPTYPEYTEPGYAVQSGYEGYLVPAVPTKDSQSSRWTSVIMSNLIPISRFALSYGTRAGYYILNLLLLLLVGGAFTTSICTFTPFCTITFLGLGLSKNEVREQVKELARNYITPERVSLATSMVKRAIDKYAALQRTQDTEDEKKEEKKDTSTEKE